jgi:toxin-antitoxin system PIN domain toxin
MKRCLVDVNVWLGLLVIQHEHHELARKWFDGLAAGEAGLCRIVQLALVRLLANRSIMGVHAVSASAAWNLLETLVEDERVDFISEPLGVDSVLPTLLNYKIPTGKLVTDAYLAAFAITASRRLVTLDRGFRQFRGLDVNLLGVDDLKSN